MRVCACVYVSRVQIEFSKIDNIHVVTSAYKQLLSIVNSDLANLELDLSPSKMSSYGYRAKVCPCVYICLIKCVLVVRVYVFACDYVCMCVHVVTCVCVHVWKCVCADVGKWMDESHM